MLELLVATPLILGITISAIIAIAILVEIEKEGWAATITSIGIAALIWHYKLEFWEVVSSDPLQTFLFILFYVVTGVVWSFIKWRVDVKLYLKRFDKVKAGFLGKFPMADAIKNNWKDWIKYLNDHKGAVRFGFNKAFYDGDTPSIVMDKIIPKSNDKKSVIVAWIAYWPMSVLATMLNNPLKKFFEWIYSLVSGLYDRMSKDMSKDAVESMK